MADTIHHSVLLEETVDFLSPVSGGIYVDGNLGLGGHTGRILEQSGPDSKVIAFEWDQSAIVLAKERLAGFAERVQYVADNFAACRECLDAIGVKVVDGILLDLGLSSYQLDKSERGFSFKGEQSLDMRMDERRSVTAAELLNSTSQEDLADMFYYYGEERQARRIAKFIVEERRQNKIENTRQLVELIERAVPRKYHPKKIHVATKVFQALRIAVNTELDNLETMLIEGPEMLKYGAKLVVITFHSLEDRLVKRGMQRNPLLEVLTKKPIVPGVEEIRKNPRARSAKLRVAQRVGS